MGTYFLNVLCIFLFLKWGYSVETNLEAVPARPVALTVISRPASVLGPSQAPEDPAPPPSMGVRADTSRPASWQPSWGRDDGREREVVPARRKRLTASRSLDVSKVNAVLRLAQRGPEPRVQQQEVFMFQQVLCSTLLYVTSPENFFIFQDWLHTNVRYEVLTFVSKKNYSATKCYRRLCDILAPDVISCCTVEEMLTNIRTRD